MSNLGLYQWMTKTAKKVGGPTPFMLIIGGSGIAIGAIIIILILLKLTY